jgi:protease I
MTVEDEVCAALARPGDFVRGPSSFTRDSPARLDAGFALRDGNYVSARWPGDAHRFATEFAGLLRQGSS